MSRCWGCAAGFFQGTCWLLAQVTQWGVAARCRDGGHACPCLLVQLYGLRSLIDPQKATVAGGAGLLKLRKLCGLSLFQV